MVSATQEPARPSVRRLAATVVLPFGFAFYLSFLVRTVNAVLSPQLARDLALTAADLGLLTSVYFFTFALFQFPLGVLLDRFGPRRVQAALLSLAVAGAVMFAVADGLALVVVGRALIGLGVSGGLMAALKANAEWWPVERLPLVNAVTATFGALGALSATLPVELLSAVLDWRGIFFGLAGLIFAAAASIVLVVPEPRAAEHAARDVRNQLADLGRIYRDPFFWRVGMTCAMHSGAFLAYQALWLGPWLRDVVGLAPVEAANALLLLNLGMLLGSFGIGSIADRLQRFGIRLVTTLAVAIGLGITTQLVFVLGTDSVPAALCLVYGFFGAGGFIVYAVLNQRYPIGLVGRVNTAQNMLAFVWAFVFQWAAGAIIGLWPEAADGRYDPDGQQAAWLTVIALEATAFVIFLATGRRSGGEAAR